MSTWVWWTGAGAVVALSLFIQYLVARRRHKRDYSEYLEPILQRQGLVFVSGRYPGIFKVGPFPKVEFQWGRPQSHVLGFRGEFSEYRTVIVQDAGGRRHQVWAMIEFEGFELRRVRWRAENKQGLPPSLLSMLEA